MGERSESRMGGGLERSFRALTELDRLLFTLIEKGAGLDPEHKKNLRAQLKWLLKNLGVSKGELGVKGLVDLRQRMRLPGEFQYVPPGFPPKDEFGRSLNNIVLSKIEADLPPIPVRLNAQDVADNAQYNWSEVKGRDDRPTLDYLYELGKIMNVSYMYQEFFKDSDKISIGDNWRVENGIHRSLVLRTLGRRFVGVNGMNEWVLVQREK